MTLEAARRQLGALAAAGPLVFTAGWLAASASQPGYSARQEDISALAALTGAHPWITMTAGVVAGLGMLALAAGVVVSLAGRDTVAGGACLAIAGVSMIIQALAREDCSTELPTCAAQVRAGHVSLHHTVHGLASVIVFMTLLGAAFLLARPFRCQPHWRSLARYSVATGAAGLVLFVAYLAVPHSWGGLTERAFVTIPMTWLAATGVRLMMTGHRAQAGESAVAC